LEDLTPLVSCRERESKEAPLQMIVPRPTNAVRKPGDLFSLLLRRAYAPPATAATATPATMIVLLLRPSSSLAAPYGPWRQVAASEMALNSESG
jgi:hypothetical protein